MLLTPQQLKAKLPNQHYFTSQEIAAAFGLSSQGKPNTWPINRAAKRYGIGKLKKRQGGVGKRIFTEADFPKLCQIIQGKPGNLSKQRKPLDGN